MTTPAPVRHLRLEYSAAVQHILVVQKHLEEVVGQVVVGLYVGPVLFLE